MKFTFNVRFPCSVIIKLTRCFTIQYRYPHTLCNYQVWELVWFLWQFNLLGNKNLIACNVHIKGFHFQDDEILKNKKGKVVIIIIFLKGLFLSTLSCVMAHPINWMIYGLTCNFTSPLKWIFFLFFERCPEDISSWIIFQVRITYVQHPSREKTESSCSWWTRLSLLWVMRVLLNNSFFGPAKFRYITVSIFWNMVWGWMLFCG